ncbi:MAG: IclR family transcriptional regulator [Propionibacteriales bacterium]|nr:IclR family transcriptional regulator [Propionibacteriales bacterium]
MTRSPDIATSDADGAPSGRVQSVDRALRLLDRVAAASPRGETVAELAAQCDLNRATAWRLLGTLEANRLVERDPRTNRYQVGFALVRMSAAAGYDGLVRRTHPVLERVSTRTGETADLAVAGLRGVTYVGEVAPASVIAANWLAREVPLHATSTGKAFLAWLPLQEAMGLLETPLRAFTDTTVTDPDRFRSELVDTRKRGYAQCAGELEPTLYGVSAPVLDPERGRPLAVFSIWGPVDRVPASRFPSLGPVAVEAAIDVRAAMTA